MSELKTPGGKAVTWLVERALLIIIAVGLVACILAAVAGLGVALGWVQQAWSR